jgi:hypothetical protein
LIAASASAADLELAEGFGSVQVHGFVSQGFIYSTKNNYLAKSTRGSFEFSEAGINFTKPLTDKLRVGLQLFARDLGPIGNYSAKLDWYSLDYRFADWLGLRAGRVKLPYGLYNEGSDVDAARVPVLLPQSVYSLTSRDYLLAQTGAELFGYLSLGAAGALDYRVYGGTIFIDLPARQTGPVIINDIGVPYVAGGRLVWETPLEGFRLGGSLLAARLDLRFTAAATPLTARVPATLWLASAEYAMRDWLFSVEYGRTTTHLRTSNPALFPNARTTGEGGFAMVSYRVSPWLQPGAYYSMLIPNVTRRGARANAQHDFAATLRFDLSSFWLVKLEGHLMRGTAALSPALNDNKPVATLADTWAAFFVKTTAVF